MSKRSWMLPLCAALTAGTISACAPRNTAPDPVFPAALVPPGNPAPFLRTTGRGVQIYTCQVSNGAATWTLRAPQAVLIDESGAPAGSHGAGPSWTATDGSVVVGTRLASVNSPDAGAIPWLLLSAKPSSSEGLFSRVTYIQRLDTVGGVAPASGCIAQTAGAETRVNYSATYLFFRN